MADGLERKRQRFSPYGGDAEEGRSKETRKSQRGTVRSLQRACSDFRV